MEYSSNIFLSILIPVFRTDISDLLHDLLQELNQSSCRFEILVLDDSADEQYFGWHAAFKRNEQLRILSFTVNKGRSACRNTLMSEAAGSHWLFLDGDMGLAKGFIRNYLQAITAQPEVVLVGGVKYNAHQTGLRTKIGIQREQSSAVERQKRPYSSFTAANLVLPMLKLGKIRFDERISSYGHEDTVFGLALLEANIPILHIDNPATHLGLDDDETYLQKIETGLETLAGLWLNNDLIEKYSKEVKLLHYWHKTRKTGLLEFVSNTTALRILRSMAKKGLFWLDLYKLAYLNKEIQRQKINL